MLDPRQTTANVVLDHPECADVFVRLRIDFSCRGNQCVCDAAADRGIDPGALVADLTRAIAEHRGPTVRDLRDLSTADLIAHIIATHHAYLRKALPAARALADSVSRAHGAGDPRLAALAQAVAELAETMSAHLDEEELQIFPAITAKNLHVLDATRNLLEMIDDHHIASALLTRIRVATEDFSSAACASDGHRALLTVLAEIERDILTHMHVENHVLAPRFTSAGARSFR